MSQGRNYRLLDVCCGDGVASSGYKSVGFDVTGIDIVPHRRYPYPFYQYDALNLDPAWLRDNYDALHFGPPCMAWSIGTRIENRDKHPKLIAPLREIALESGLPYVIENVPGAPLNDPVELCGCMFSRGVIVRNQWFALYRPRLFEIPWFTGRGPAHSKHLYPAIDVYGHSSPGRFYRQYGFGVTVDDMRKAMGASWPSRDGLAQGIPPAFTNYIGARFIAYLNRVARGA